MKEDTEFDKLRSNVDSAFTNMRALSLALLDQLKKERELSDRLAEVIWLLKEPLKLEQSRIDELVDASLTVFRRHRQWREDNP